MSAKGSGEAGRRGERRHNLELRERIDELLDVVRLLSRERSTISDAELERRLSRIEWLAEEIWQSAAYGPGEGNGES